MRHQTANVAAPYPNNDDFYPECLRNRDDGCSVRIIPILPRAKAGRTAAIALRINQPSESAQPHGVTDGHRGLRLSAIPQRLSAARNVLIWRLSVGRFRFSFIMIFAYDSEDGPISMITWVLASSGFNGSLLLLAGIAMFPSLSSNCLLR